MDVNGEVQLLWGVHRVGEASGRGGSGVFFLGGGGGPIRGWAGEDGSKVWGRWVMWGMGDVNQE